MDFMREDRGDPNEAWDDMVLEREDRTERVSEAGRVKPFPLMFGEGFLEPGFAGIGGVSSPLSADVDLRDWMEAERLARVVVSRSGVEGGRTNKKGEDACSNNPGWRDGVEAGP